MARCGSGALCTCAGGDGCGTQWTGSGQAGVDPIRVDIVNNCEDACQVYTECVGENLDQGLRYNAQTGLIGTYLSADDGQQLRYGTDGGLLHTGTCPDPTCCSTTVAGLPSAPNVVGGMDGCGRLIRPPAVLDAYRQGVRQQLDIVHMEVIGLRDGTPVLPIFGSPVSSYSDAPSSGPWDDDVPQWDAATWGKLILQPSGEGYTAYGDTSVIDPGTGWGGFREATQVGGTFLSDVLDIVGGKTVAVIGTTVNAALAVRDELQSRCLQDGAIVLVPNADTAAIFTDAQIAVGIRIDTQSQADQWPPDAIQAIGAEWVMAHHSNVGSPTIETYANAGLQVLAHSITRQTDVAAMREIGVRGIVSDDPLYASGQTDRYRTDRDQWAYRTPGHGLLTEATDQGNWRSRNRGFTMLPPNEADSYGLVVQGGAPQEDGWWTINMGPVCPLRNATDYTLNFAVRWDSDPGTPGNTILGVLACAPDDRLIQGGDSADMYLAGLRQNGTMVLWKYVGGERVELASTEIGTVPLGTFYSLQLVVASDGLTFTKISPGQNEFITTSDTDLRGPWFSLLKSQGATNYNARFASVIYRPGGVMEGVALEDPSTLP